MNISLCVCSSVSLRDSEGRKLCKKVKVDPSSKHGAAELLHYKWVSRHWAGCQAFFTPGCFFWRVIAFKQLEEDIIQHLLLGLCALCLVCLAEMGPSTQSTTGLLLLRWVPVWNHAVSASRFGNWIISSPEPGVSVHIWFIHLVG